MAMQVTSWAGHLIHSDKQWVGVEQKLPDSVSKARNWSGPHCLNDFASCTPVDCRWRSSQVPPIPPLGKSVIDCGRQWHSNAIWSSAILQRVSSRIRTTSAKNRSGALHVEWIQFPPGNSLILVNLRGSLVILVVRRSGVATSSGKASPAESRLLSPASAVSPAVRFSILSSKLVSLCARVPSWT